MARRIAKKMRVEEGLQMCRQGGVPRSRGVPISLEGRKVPRGRGVPGGRKVPESLEGRRVP